MSGVLTEGAKYAEQVLSPTNGPGDAVGGAARQDGRSSEFPPGYAAAYAQYAADGWVEPRPARARLAGRDCREVLQAAFAEMTNGANMAFSMLPVALQRRRRGCWSSYGGDELVQRFGQGSSTARVEPRLSSRNRRRAQTSAGCRPERRHPGWYFSAARHEDLHQSYGDHELAPQIIHMVLARTPDSAPGTRGISTCSSCRRSSMASGTLCGSSGSSRRWASKVRRPASSHSRMRSAATSAPRAAGCSRCSRWWNTMRLEVAIQGVGIAGRGDRARDPLRTRTTARAVR